MIQVNKGPNPFLQAVFFLERSLAILVLSMRSPLEQLWYDFLVEHNIEFEEQVPIGNYVAESIDLEIDGLQHSSKKNRLRDAKRDKYFKSIGFDVIRLPMNYHSMNKRKHRERFEQQKQYLLSRV